MSFNTIPENGWPQLKRLDELAQKVGNIPTFTSSDKEAIEDLISNAQALIEVAENGAAGVPFDNTGTDFESTNVQGAIEEAATMGASGDEYTTTEEECGKWLGAPLYRKTVNLEGLPNATYKDVSSGLSNITVVKMVGIATGADGTIPIPYAALDTYSKNVTFTYLYADNVIRVSTGVDRTGFTSAYCTLYYTKNPTP